MRLEVGVGTTDFQRLVAPCPFLPKIAGRDVVYMDLARPDISIENFIRGDAEHLPFKTESFSLICASHVIEHLAHPEKFLAECWRTLKQNGEVRLWCPSFLSTTAHNPFHKQVFNYRSLHKMITETGFASNVIGRGFFLRQYVKDFLSLFWRTINKISRVWICDKVRATFCNELIAIGTKGIKHKPE